MIEKTHPVSDFSSVSLLLFLFKWRFYIAGITLLAGIAAAIFSGPVFITPKFMSKVVMFPISSNSISKALLSENTGIKHDLMEFGEEEQAEQMLQILNSNEIRTRIVEKYNLMQHYEIDTTSRYKNTLLYMEYDDNIRFKRTEFMAVEIMVMDKNPQLAADIANDLSNLYDSLKISMQRERAVRGLQIVEAEYHGLRDYIREMDDSLSRLREMGIHDYETQAEMINQQLAIEVAKGNQRGAKALYEKLDVLAKYGGAYVSIRDQLEHERKQLSFLKGKYDQAKIDATEDLPQKFLVEAAFKAEKKSYPVRWLIVAVSMVAAFILTIIAIVGVESMKKVRQAFRSEIAETV